ncbi:hypothetical protein [Streptomyces sp. NPDC048002]|uniref:hypothetical protein n=1 Tax=Streptomyces sp. NPDC048002 TaxID=3154344 RepID=UPI0033C2152C
MQQSRRRDRCPERRAASEPARHLGHRPAVADTDVVLVGLFSAKRKDFEALMASAAGELVARGARVVAHLVQRRGVSDGGVRKMGLPYSSRTLLSYGKVREVTQVCERTNADAVVFVVPLSERQRRTLTGLFDRPAVSLSDLLAAD